MEKVRKVIIEIKPMDGAKNEDGRQEFEFDMNIKTVDGSSPKKSEVLWVLQLAIESVTNAQ